MFGNQSMVAQLVPQYPILYCPNQFYSCYVYHHSCNLGYYSIGCPGFAFSIPAPVGPSDPVEALQALRQQLEVTLAGVRAQEEELQRQRAATGGEGGQQGRGGRAARTPRSE